MIDGDGRSSAGAAKRIAAGVALLCALALIASAPAVAAERNQSLGLYGFGTSIDGDINFGDRDNEVDVDAGDILDALELAAFARYRWQNERWAAVFDGQYASLGATGDRGPIETELDTNLYIFQADAGYRFTDTAEALFGVRYVRFEGAVDVRFAGDGAVHRANDASFWDPVIGLRTLRPLGEKLRLQAQGDIGGGANMDLTWQAMVHLGWQLSDGMSVWLGYRAIDMEFDHSGGRNRINADFILHGPEAGLVFHF